MTATDRDYRADDAAADAGRLAVPEVPLTRELFREQ